MRYSWNPKGPAKPAKLKASRWPSQNGATTKLHMQTRTSRTTLTRPGKELKLRQQGAKPHWATRRQEAQVAQKPTYLSFVVPSCNPINKVGSYTQYCLYQLASHMDDNAHYLHETKQRQKSCTPGNYRDFNHLGYPEQTVYVCPYLLEYIYTLW